MKAICGSIRFDGTPGNPREVEVMRTALLGRGVAQGQSICDGAAALAGITWSPVVDAIADPTLYAHPESGCMIVADALLFERAELFAVLQLPTSAQSAISDTELILRAWLRWGEGCAERLDGDFAFVVWDPRIQCVYAARDGMGVRPLYIHHTDGVLFAFGSNASAVVASPQVPLEINERRIGEFLTNREDSDVTSTFYRAVRRLPPAHWCSMDARGYRETCYWSPGERPPAVLPVGDAEWTEAVREALDRAVRQHVIGTLRTGGAIGSMVSGGLDSSAVAAIASDILAADGRGPLPTFSGINSANPGCAETRAIRAMLARPGFVPNTIDAAHLDAFLPELLQCIAASEEPFDGTMSLLHAQFAMASRAGVSAVLDGVDADALFSEGGHMMRLLRSGRWFTAYREAVGMAPFYGPGWPAWKQLAVLAPVAFVPESLKRSVRGIRQRREFKAAVRDSLIAPDFAWRIALHEPSRRSSRSGSDHESALLLERRSTICAASIATGVERYRRTASMHGIESRHPFLDRRLVELCMHLPDRQRARDGWTKAVLRYAVANRLPDAVCWRRGKEHLGGRYNQLVFDHDQNANLDDLWENRRLLEPYVDLAGLGRHIANYRRDSNNEYADLVLEAWHLLSWLRRQRLTLA